MPCMAQACRSMQFSVAEQCKGQKEQAHLYSRAFRGHPQPPRHDQRQAKLRQCRQLRHRPCYTHVVALPVLLILPDVLCSAAEGHNVLQTKPIRSFFNESYPLLHRVHACYLYRDSKSALTEVFALARRREASKHIQEALTQASNVLL